ncbi:MAG TPA: 3-deoxy-D-manno-octulosonic acid transferase [Verrucomicrobiae bacterium]
MRFLYNILFVIFFCLSAPYYFWKMWRRGNWQAGFKQRFGRYEDLPPADPKRPAIWLHAVSVGEVNICAQVIRDLRQRAPQYRIIVSTTTSTGMGELRKRLPEDIEKVYYPVDFLPFVKRALNRIQPVAVALIEAEIWPNFLWELQRRDIPRFLVNARVSERSYRGYRRFSFLFAPLFKSFQGIGAQNEEDSVRLREIGCRPETVHVFGNLKFDAVHLPTKRPIDVPTLLASLGVKSDAPILLGGSTFPGEEKILGDIFLRLRQQHPDLFLVLVPRHFERAHEALADLNALGLKVTLRSELNGLDAPQKSDCLLVNSTGELVFFYEHATVVFVGKSITANGGQSPIEPAALGKAMTFGPNMQNFTSIVRAFLQANGAVQVKDVAELERVLADLLHNPTKREELGRNGLAVVKQNQGATQRTIDMLLTKIP